MAEVYLRSCKKESQNGYETYNEETGGSSKVTEESKHLLYLKEIVGDSKSEDSRNSQKTNEF